jgi:hypothetical protein
MPSPEFSTSKRKLIEIMRTHAPTERMHKDAKAFLEIKTQRSLIRATWALGFATIGLIAAAIAQIIIILGARA